MANGPMPIGQMHVRDFADLRQQRTLAELPADPEGFVRFRCMKCPRTGKIELANLQERFKPTEGLVNILNTLTPTDCPMATVDAWGNRPCGFCFRDLGGARGRAAIAAR